MKPRIGDILVVVAVTLLAVASLLFGLGTKTAQTALEAQIYQNGRLIQVVKLDKVTAPTEIRLDGAAANTLLAEHGRICYEHSDCPDKTCVHTGWLSRPGQIAACLPNRTLVKIVGSSTDEDVVLH